MRKIRTGALLFTLVVSTALLFSCVPSTDPAPEPDPLPSDHDYVSFTIDGSAVSLKAGPTGTASGPSSSTVTFGGTPAAFQYVGTSTTFRLLAALSSGTYSPNFATDASGRILIEIPSGSVGTYVIPTDGGSASYDFVGGNPKIASTGHTITVWITKNGGVGGYLEGTFSGTLTILGTDSYSVTGGSFSVKIYADVTSS